MPKAHTCTMIATIEDRSTVQTYLLAVLRDRLRSAELLARTALAHISKSPTREEARLSGDMLVHQYNVYGLIEMWLSRLLAEAPETQYSLEEASDALASLVQVSTGGYDNARDDTTRDLCKWACSILASYEATLINLQREITSR